jgi:hypothetical protein
LQVRVRAIPAVARTSVLAGRSEVEKCMKKVTLLMLAGVLIAAAPAYAQQMSRLRGTVEKLDGGTLTVKGDSGEVKIRVADNAQVFGVTKGTLADLKPNAFIGVGAMPQTDGSQKAIQVTIFAESQRGAGEGFRPWDRPGSTMTNGTVDTTVKAVEGQQLTVKYKGGEKKIVITPETIIRAYVAGSKDDLKPGAHIVAYAVKNAGGSYDANRINVGRDGVAP